MPNALLFNRSKQQDGNNYILQLRLTAQSRDITSLKLQLNSFLEKHTTDLSPRNNRISPTVRGEMSFKNSMNVFSVFLVLQKLPLRYDHCWWQGENSVIKFLTADFSAMCTP